MTDKTDMIVDRDLEGFFQSARDHTPEPSPDLLARILDDAYSEQPAPPETVAAPLSEQPRRGWFASLAETIGGWPAVAGLATAAIAGVWIGYSSPEALSIYSEALLDSSYGLTMDSSLPDYSSVAVEG